MPRSFIAELVISHPDLPLMPTIRAEPDLTLTVESQPFTYLDEPVLFVSVRDSGFADLEASLERDHTVADWETALVFEDCRVYQLTLSPDAKFSTPEITDLGIQILSIKSTPEGWHFQLQASNREVLGSYWQYCRDEHIEFDLEKVYTTESRARVTNTTNFKAQLTDRQREVARTVARMGYYEPDGASADEVAAALGISQSTLSTHLRRILAKLFEHEF